MVRYTTKKPTSGVLLGIVMYSDSKYEIRNIGGRPYFIVYSRLSKKYLGSFKNSGGAFMLRQLGIEVNAKGGMFMHYSSPKKTYRNMTRKQIVEWQKKY